MVVDGKIRVDLGLWPFDLKI